MTFASSFCKKGHCIHILWCIFMGLGHNDPWVESHIRPQQMWGQRSSRGKWPVVQVFAKNITVSTYFHVCSGETCGSRTTCLVLCVFSHKLTTACSFILVLPNIKYAVTHPFSKWGKVYPLLTVFRRVSRVGALSTETPSLGFWKNSPVAMQVWLGKEVRVPLTE